MTDNYKGRIVIPNLLVDNIFHDKRYKFGVIGLDTQTLLFFILTTIVKRKNKEIFIVFLELLFVV